MHQIAPRTDRAEAELTAWEIAHLERAVLAYAAERDDPRLADLVSLVVCARRIRVFRNATATAA
jgi:hypothetical protein